MEGPRRVPNWGEFDVVDRGWSPAQVREIVGRLVDELAAAQRNIEELAADEAARVRGEILGRAEHEAEDIRRAAFESAQRTRVAATEQGRDITIQARRDALDILQRARLDAESMVAEATGQERALHERIRNLQAVVGRTEALLRDVAEGELGEVHVLETEDSPISATNRGIEVVVAAEQARAERRLQSVPEPSSDRLPDSVERLLDALRGPGAGER